MAERAGVTGVSISPYTVSVAAGLSSMSLSTQASGWFGPGQPIAPNVPDEVRGRAFDYPSGYNFNLTPKAYEPIGFATLRALADAYDLLRLVIETRKDQIARMRWVVKNRDGVKKDYSKAIAAITKFLRKPDGEMNWPDWLRVVLEDLFVLDAPALYMKRDDAGNLLAMEHVDGATIKRVIDDFGRTPSPTIASGRISYPVAYQQILKGQALNYTALNLLYRPRNRRSHRVYGYGPVEQVLTTVNIALRRQATTLEYFTDGTVPDAFIGVPKEWSPQQIRDFQGHWDALFTNQTAIRRRAKFVPGGTTITQTREPELKGEFDEWIARVICYAFSVSSQAFSKMMNRATAQTAKESAEEEGLAPVLDWIKSLADDVIADEFGFSDLEFAWQEDTALDETAMSAIVEGQVAKGLITVNEGRTKLGIDPSDNPAADKLMVMTATGFVLLESNTIEGKQAMQDAFPPPPPQLPPPAGGAPAAGAPKPGRGGQGGQPAQRGGSARQPSARAQKLAKAADAGPEPIAADDQEQAIADALEPALGATADEVAKQVEAAIGKHQQSGTGEDVAAAVAAILAGLSFAPMVKAELVLTIAEQLRAVAEDGATRGVAEATDGQADAGQAAQAVEASEADADARAAEMVGLKWTAAGGSEAEKTLAVDPSAQRNIVATMRNEVSAAVEKGLEAGSDAASIAADVRGLAIFGKAHAKTVAAAEAMSIGNKGLVHGFKAAGVALNKRWNITSEACTVCKRNAAEGAVPLAHVFLSGDSESPAHPYCRCVMTCEPVDLDKGFSPGESRDAAGRWTGGGDDGGADILSILGRGKRPAQAPTGAKTTASSPQLSPAEMRRRQEKRKTGKNPARKHSPILKPRKTGELKSEYERMHTVHLVVERDLGDSDHLQIHGAFVRRDDATASIMGHHRSQVNAMGRKHRSTPDSQLHATVVENDLKLAERESWELSDDEGKKAPFHVHVVVAHDHISGQKAVEGLHRTGTRAAAHKIELTKEEWEKNGLSTGATSKEDVTPAQWRRAVKHWDDNYADAPDAPNSDFIKPGQVPDPDDFEQFYDQLGEQYPGPDKANELTEGVGTTYTVHRVKVR